MKLDIEKLLQEANTLSPPQKVLLDLLKQLDDPETTVKDFQETIGKDPILTAKTLKLANSAYFGYSREISTISDAVVVLGLDTIRSFAVAASAFQTINGRFDGYGLKRGELWLHALSSANVASYIAKKVKLIKNSEKYFVAGLMHDIGKLLLNKYVLKFFDFIFDYIEEKEVSFDLAETGFLGINHCIIGAKLAEYWNFPLILQEVIQNHHSLDNLTPENKEIISAVHISDFILLDHKIALGHDSLYYDKNPLAFEILNISDEDYIDLKQDVKTMLENVAHLEF